MKVSAHRYRQSRQGATFASSKWATMVIAGSMTAVGLILVIAVLAVKHGI